MEWLPIVVGFTSGFAAALAVTVALVLSNATMTWKLRVGIILLSGVVAGLVHLSVEQLR